MSDTDKVRRRIDEDIARDRINSIETPFLIMGRDGDHLQGVFRTTFDLMSEASKEVEWVSYDHDFHGYVFPVRGDDGNYELNDIQIEAIDHVVDWLAQKLGA